MHDIRFIRDNPQAFDDGLAKRGLAPMAAQLIALDEERRRAIAAAQEAQQRRNALSKEIGQAKAKKDDARANGLASGHRYWFGLPIGADLPYPEALLSRVRWRCSRCRSPTSPTC